MEFITATSSYNYAQLYFFIFLFFHPDRGSCIDYSINFLYTEDLYLFVIMCINGQI